MLTMTDKQKRLRELMAKHKVIGSRKQLSDFWGVPLHSVHAYLKPNTSISHRGIPTKRLRDLELKLDEHAND